MKANQRQKEADIEKTYETLGKWNQNNESNTNANLDNNILEIQEAAPGFMPQWHGPDNK